MNRVLFLPLLALLALLPGRGSAETTLGTALDTVPITISKPGIYHFVKNVGFAPLAGAAVTIAATDVVLDLDGHAIVATSGSTNTAVGIFCNNFNRITIKDGTIRGFRTGVGMVSDGCRLNDLFVTDNFGGGITLVGYNDQISHNRVFNTGGAPPAYLTAIGISLTGTFGTVTDNDVENTVALDGTSHYGDGIRLKGCSQIVVSNNRVLDVEPSAPVQGGASTGIATVSSDTLIFLGNTVLTTQTGFDFSGAASGKYGDNITDNVSTDYNTSGSGILSIGNNN